jgi:hypothetical protein
MSQPDALGQQCLALIMRFLCFPILNNLLVKCFWKGNKDGAEACWLTKKEVGQKTVFSRNKCLDDSS